MFLLGKVHFPSRQSAFLPWAMVEGATKVVCISPLGRVLFSSGQKAFVGDHPSCLEMYVLCVDTKRKQSCRVQRFACRYKWCLVDPAKGVWTEECRRARLALYALKVISASELLPVV